MANLRVPAQWMGWRLRGLVTVALAACLVVFALTRWLVATPVLEAQPPTMGAIVQRPSPRWQLDDALRSAQIAQQRALSDALVADPASAHLRGYAGLGLLFWPLCALALLVTLVGAVVVLSRPHAVNFLYLVMALCQAGNLLLLAATSVRGNDIGLPPRLLALDMPLRMALDIATAAAATHAFALHPRRLRTSSRIAALAWAAATLLVGSAWAGLLPGLWWWVQGGAIGMGLAALWVLGLSYRTSPDPVAALLRRFCLVTVATLALVTIAVAAVAWQPALPQGVAEIAVIVWTVFFASLLLLAPFISGSRQVMREFALLAGISTVAASLDLLFVAVFSLGPFTSLALVVFLALGLYAGARQWIMSQVVGSNVLTTERIFEQLYRAAREVQQHPHTYGTQLAALLRDLFEPMEVIHGARAEQAPPRSHVASGGSALVVPLHALGNTQAATPSGAIVLRFARRGQSIFTREDARLADRVVEQLRRAVAYDLAVERGRHEERQRIAQDLHDDIGARLLTLMYQAPNPEMEDYVRHTLKDLKTLTRGLAADEHRFSHAVAEWKADISQRLVVAHIDLEWQARWDHDGLLSMVQWSALTRVLRELVSNTLHHGHASCVVVSLELQAQRLHWSVADDGDGRAPQAWSHGLGLGGVRKRVKLLGGTVSWRENEPRGIVCEVLVPEFITR